MTRGKQKIQAQAKAHEKLEKKRTAAAHEKPEMKSSAFFINKTIRRPPEQQAPKSNSEPTIPTLVRFFLLETVQQDK
ncbi:hypothetical protein Pelo_16654 [Pelomyxa schiedti]|nr:hypothetical protein Pelo_16654 [Pelomyxa schiedti]